MDGALRNGDSLEGSRIELWRIRWRRIFLYMCTMCCCFFYLIARFIPSVILLFPEWKGKQERNKKQTSLLTTISAVLLLRGGSLNRLLGPEGFLLWYDASFPFRFTDKSLGIIFLYSRVLQTSSCIVTTMETSLFIVGGTRALLEALDVRDSEYPTLHGAPEFTLKNSLSLSLRFLLGLHFYFVFALHFSFYFALFAKKTMMEGRECSPTNEPRAVSLRQLLFVLLSTPVVCRFPDFHSVLIYIYTASTTFCFLLLFSLFFPLHLHLCLLNFSSIFPAVPLYENRYVSVILLFVEIHV